MEKARVALFDEAEERMDFDNDFPERLRDIGGMDREMGGDPSSEDSTAGVPVDLHARVPGGLLNMSLSSFPVPNLEAGFSISLPNLTFET